MTQFYHIAIIFKYSWIPDRNIQE